MPACRRVALSILLAAAVLAGPAVHDIHATARQTLAFPVIRAQPGKQVGVDGVVEFGPALAISALAFSPDGATLAVGGYQEVLLWDLAQARLARRIGAGELDGMIHAVAFLDGGKALAVGDGSPGAKGAVKIFSTADGKRTATFGEPKGTVYCLAVSPDGTLLAAGSADTCLYVYDLKAGKPATTIDAHADWVLGAQFSADGKRLLTAGADRTMRVWEVGTWKMLLQYDQGDCVHAAVLGPDNDTVVGAVSGPTERGLVIGRVDADLKVAAQRKPRARLIGTGALMPLDIIWPGKGQNVFVPFNDGRIRAYQGASGRGVRTFDGHTDWVYAVAATDDGKRLASGGADGTVRLWDAEKGPMLATLVHLAPGSDGWLIMTPAGHFAASAPDALAWRAEGDAKPPDGLTDRYQKPDLVVKALGLAPEPEKPPPPKPPTPPPPKETPKPAPAKEAPKPPDKPTPPKEAPKPPDKTPPAKP